MMPVSTARSELLKKRLDRFTRALPGVEKGDVRALHQARVASRRLRELLPMFHLEPDTTRKISRRLRKVTSRLGTVRELDVLLLLIDELHVSRRERGAALARVGVRVSKSRDHARKRLTARLPVAEMWRLANKLDKLAGELKVADQASSKTAGRSWRWAVDARVASRATRLSAAIHDAGAVYLPERLHAVRIALKKLRYALELSAELGGVKTDGGLRALKRGQDLLGRMHDLQVLIDRGRRVQASLVPPNLTVWRELDALLLSLDDDCRRLHARYMRARDVLLALTDTLNARPHQGPGRVQATRRAG
jgi:CHAD domain-containing protein